MARRRKEREAEPPGWLVELLKELYNDMVGWRDAYGFAEIAGFVHDFDTDVDKPVEYFVSAAFVPTRREALEVIVERKGKVVFRAFVKKDKVQVYTFTPNVDVIIRSLLLKVHNALGEVVAEDIPVDV